MYYCYGSELIKALAVQLVQELTTWQAIFLVWLNHTVSFSVQYLS
jgi:hypothetical protein